MPWKSHVLSQYEKADPNSSLSGRSSHSQTAAFQYWEQGQTPPVQPAFGGDADVQDLEGIKLLCRDFYAVTQNHGGRDL